jgi:hypothetical protein
MPAAAGRPMFSATDALGYAWKAFTANIGPLIIIGLVIFGVNFVIQLLQYSFDSWILRTVANAAAIFLSLVLALGLIRATLIIVDGRSPKVEDVLSTKDLSSYIVASVLVWLLTFAGFLLCVFPMFIVIYLFQFYGYAILDKKSDEVDGVPSSDPVGALRTSMQITTAHIGELLLLLILLFAINLIGGLLCGLGLIVSIPVSYIALGYAWRHFTNGPIAAQA